MKLFDFTVNNTEEINLYDLLNYTIWSEIETSEVKRPFHSKKINISDDETVALWYDFGGDYYFFEEL